ncbi:hypothetical protein BN1051_01027 [Arthrobacter saudimassiliensis]|uniref:Activator of Hsp90 ATPase homologue 1/2-like C-terminal domain-containing protein n=1 Tax=Arthrobacter saudimassiliensis TaxID=1461584 RepID=A0A078MS99_9MICC|nr:hypothetical protein BN1051_01027 [Arthrobacter saudimassiliensis]
MSVTDVQKDYDSLSLTLTAELPAPPERVWQLWADPRLLERWWGPPTWPATVDSFDFRPGGEVAYHMTGPDGSVARGWWVLRSIEEPVALAFEDGFADDDGRPSAELPVMPTTVQLAPSGDRGTTMTISTAYASRQDMERVLEMGMAEGLREAVSQMDGLLVSA